MKNPETVGLKIGDHVRLNALGKANSKMMLTRVHSPGGVVTRLVLGDFVEVLWKGFKKSLSYPHDHLSFVSRPGSSGAAAKLAKKADKEAAARLFVQGEQVVLSQLGVRQNPCMSKEIVGSGTVTWIAASNNRIGVRWALKNSDGSTRPLNAGHFHWELNADCNQVKEEEPEAERPLKTGSIVLLKDAKNTFASGSKVLSYLGEVAWTDGPRAGVAWSINYTDGASARLAQGHFIHELREVPDVRRSMPHPTPEANPTPKPTSILQEAEDLVNGDRAQQYGTPEDNFSRIRDLCRATGRQSMAALSAEDLAIILILVKVARDTQVPKRDNAVDIAGYAYILDKVRGL